MMIGAFAVICAALVVTACLGICWEWYRDWKLDRDIRRGFREAKKRGWIK
jgi:hypothetical protein